ncbi:unnamed protein product, partial [Polarella glacialis]
VSPHKSSLRRGALRLRALLALFEKVPAAERLLRWGLIAGDVELVLETLHPELVARGCMGFRRGLGARPGILDYGYEDDKYRADVPAARALDYLCQGSKRGDAGQPRARRRARASGARRAALLRRLWAEPLHAAVLSMQLEDCTAVAVSPETSQLRRNFRLAMPTPLHRCASVSGDEVIRALEECTDWRPWKVYPNWDAAWEQDEPTLPAKDLQSCRLRCFQQGFSGFVVVNSVAYFKRHSAPQLLREGAARPGATLHVAAGPRAGRAALTKEALAALVMGLDAWEQTALDLALRCGHTPTIRALGRLGCTHRGLELEQKEAAILDRVLYGGLPQWLARAVGTAVGTLASGSASAEPESVVLEDAQQILSRVLQDRQQVQRVTGTSAAVAEALLRHFGHSPETAIGAYRADPAAAKAAAKVPLMDLEEAPGPGPGTSETLRCGVCFMDLQPEHPSGAAARLLPCRGAHPFCGDCLMQYITGRLGDGDVRGIVCPDPNCRLPLGEEAVEAIAGSAAAEKFVRLAAASAVDSAAHLAWCPRPGCGKAVARKQGLTARCGCGFRFCSSCLMEGGHEPCTCQQLDAWRAVYPEEQSGTRREERHKLKEKTDAWLTRNAQKCPGCRGIVERSGGCNHMICRCGAHFCYVCGRRWEEHMNQAGGLHFYQCRLPKAASGNDLNFENRNAKDEDPLLRFEGSDRSAVGARNWALAAASLWE